VGIQLPPRVFGQVRFHPVEVIKIIGAQAQIRSGSCVSRQTVEHSPAEQTVLVMPLLGPRIRKQDQDTCQDQLGWQTLKKLVHICPDKAEIGQTRLILLAQGASDPVSLPVDTDTVLIRMRLGVSGQVMAMPTPQFQRDHRMLRHDLGQDGRHLAATVFNDGSGFWTDGSGMRMHDSGCVLEIERPEASRQGALGKAAM
jgi:hypothetical protein